MSIAISDQITLALPLPLDSKSSNILLSENTITIESKSQFLLRLGSDRELEKKYQIYEAEEGSWSFNIGLWEDKINEGLVWAKLYKFEGGIRDINFVPYVSGDEIVIVDNLESHSTTDALSANQGRVLKEMIDNQVILYTNEEPTTADVGGISEGSTFENKTIQEMFDMLLYPYQYPAFTSFSISNVASKLEVGTGYTNPRFVWTITNSQNVIFEDSGEILYVSGDLQLLAGIPNTGFYQSTQEEVKRIDAGIKTYQISIMDTNENIHYRDYYITWDYKMFHGTVDSAPETSSDIRGLANNAFITNSFSININAEKYVIAIPDTKTLQEVRTSNFEDITPNFIQQDNIDVELADGVTTKSYKVYLLTTALPLDVTATVTLI